MRRASCVTTSGWVATAALAAFFSVPFSAQPWALAMMPKGPSQFRGLIGSRCVFFFLLAALDFSMNSFFCIQVRDELSGLVADIHVAVHGDASDHVEHVHRVHSDPSHLITPSVL